ncbi:DUF4189 domain-containing protein [Nocardia jejuensis]|uniref:DUF4189 domain-containing protein n=1 Tax=Nocardia jejuensis TaxID=328049 RepID=UPI0008334B3D|nr:DUF4189 domain-containing protein [Nocardia jejuensis]
MSLSRKTALGVVATTAAALFTGGMGTAHADGDQYGAMALAWYRDGSVQIGTAWDARTQADADRVALDYCKLSSCTVEVRWSNGCAAIATRGEDFWWALGSTRAEAERNALAATGPDPNPILVSFGSSEPSRADVVESQCTSNAG